MKPLSEREIGECMVAVSDPLQWGVLKGNGAHVREFVRAIEAKLASREAVQAVPSLREALEACLPFIDDACDVYSVFPDSAASNSCREAVKKARAALAASEPVSAPPGYFEKLQAAIAKSTLLPAQDTSNDPPFEPVSAQEPSKVPKGWKLVPDEANMTDEQAEAICALVPVCGGGAYDIYRAILAASPEAPQVAPGEAVEPVAWHKTHPTVFVPYTSSKKIAADWGKEDCTVTAFFTHPPKDAEGVMPRNPEMDAMVKGMHASEAFKVPNVAKELRAALQSTDRKGAGE